MPTGDVFPAFVVALVFAFITTFLILVNRFQRRDRELIHVERLAAIEKGLPLPDDIFSTPYTGDPRPVGEAPPALQEALKRVPGNAFKTGMTLLALGIGLVAAFLLAQPGWGHWVWGLVVALLGAADLVYWFSGGRAEWEQGQAFQAEARRLLLESLKPGAAATRSDRER